MRVPVHYGQSAVGKTVTYLGSRCQAVLLCLTLLLSSSVCSAAVSNQALAAASNAIFPDFTLASAHAEAGQRLLEQRGAPVMVLVLDKCDRCEKSLTFFTQLANSYQQQDLVSWVIWTPYKQHVPPSLAIPVLNAHSNPSVTFAAERPLIYLINRDGSLAHTLTGSLRALAKTTESVLDTWMQSQQRPLKP